MGLSQEAAAGYALRPSAAAEMLLPGVCAGRGDPRHRENALLLRASWTITSHFCLFNLQKKSPCSPFSRVRYLGVHCIFFLGRGNRKKSNIICLCVCLL